MDIALTRPVRLLPNGRDIVVCNLRQAVDLMRDELTPSHRILDHWRAADLALSCALAFPTSEHIATATSALEDALAHEGWRPPPADAGAPLAAALDTMVKDADRALTRKPERLRKAD